MPRKPRFNLPDVPQHITQRGNNRQPCFYTERDYQHYLLDLYESSKKYHCDIHAYVLMTNHVHILVTPKTKYGVSQMMQALGRRYVSYINKTYNRTGSLWEGRYKSSLIDSEKYLLTCMRYIELNPVRARMVTHPESYEWSSYSANANGQLDDLITYHPIYRGLDSCKQLRLANYRSLFKDTINDDTLAEIRFTLNHELALGRSTFKNKVEKITKRQTELGTPGRPYKTKNKDI